MENVISIIEKSDAVYLATVDKDGETLTMNYGRVDGQCIIMREKTILTIQY